MYKENLICKLIFLTLFSISSLGAMESPNNRPREMQRQTDLGAAVRMNNLEAARKIFQEGPLNVNFVHPFGAIHRHTTEDRIRRGQPVLEEYYEDLTPLMWAAYKGNQEMVELLLQAGARVDLKNPQGLTASDIAIAMDHPEIAKLIKEKTTMKYSSLHEQVAHEILEMEGGPEAIEGIKEIIPPIKKNK